jgi:hypothetical protein
MCLTKCPRHIRSSKDDAFFLGQVFGYLNMINLALIEFDILATRASRLRRPVGTIVTFLHEDCGLT